jgi:serine/threonine protein kinase
MFKLLARCGALRSLWLVRLPTGRWGRLSPTQRLLQKKLCSAQKGTPGHRAPEIVNALQNGAAKHDIYITPAVDVYSYGLLLLELFSGKLTWPDSPDPPINHGPDPQARILRLVSQEAQRMKSRATARPVIQLPILREGLEKDVEALVTHCTTLEPERRPTFAWIAESLEAMLPRAARRASQQTRHHGVLTVAVDASPDDSTLVPAAMAAAIGEHRRQSQ